MKNLILISILLNAGVVLGIFYSMKERVSDSGPTTVSPTGTSSQPQGKVVKRKPKTERIVVTQEGEKFNWRDVESADYKNYIFNLRQIQCPEETIRDIIIADVNKFYLQKLLPLKKPRQEKAYEFWKRDDYWWARQEENKEYREAAIKIEKEKSELLKELLGADYAKELSKQYGWSDPEQEKMYEAMPQATKEAMGEIQRKFSELTQAVYRKAKGNVDEEDQAEIRKIERQQHDELAKILSPEQLLEMEVRQSNIAQNMKWQLEGFDPSEEEFRALFKAKQSAEFAATSVESDADDKATREQRAKATKEADDQIKSILGEDRYKEYQLAQDWEYKNLVRITDRQGLTKEDAKKVYDMKKDVEKAANQIRRDKTLTSEQRNQKLLEIKTTTEQEVTETLGEKGFKSFKRNAYWLRNLVPPEPSKPAVKFE
jgi:hypothetical protein